MKHSRAISLHIGAVTMGDGAGGGGAGETIGASMQKFGVPTSAECSCNVEALSCHTSF